MRDLPPEDVHTSLLVRFNARAGLDMLDVLRDEATSPEALEAYLHSLHEHKLTELWACMLAVTAHGNMASIVAEAVEELLDRRGMTFALGGSFASAEEAERSLRERGLTHPVVVVSEPSLPTTVADPDAPTA